MLHFVQSVDNNSNYSTSTNNFNSSQTNITCFGQCTGSSTAAVSGGAGGFTYTWTAPTPSVIAGQSTPTVSALCAGNYTLTVATWICSVPPQTFTITQPAQINSNFTTTSITCNGLCNGIINSYQPCLGPLYSYTLTLYIHWCNFKFCICIFRRFVRKCNCGIIL